MNKEAIEIESDPRAELAKYYSLNGELPAAVQNKVFPKKKQVSIDSIKGDEFDNERKIIAKMLQDSRITLSQRESISTSILNGKYQVNNDSSPPSPNKNTIQRVEKEISQTKGNFIDLNRHNLRKPHFLEIVTESTKIPTISPKEVYESKISLIRSKGRDTPAAMDPGPRVKEMDLAHMTKEIQNKMLDEYRL